MSDKYKPKRLSLSHLAGLYWQGKRASYELIPEFECYTPVVVPDVHEPPFFLPPRIGDVDREYQYQAKRRGLPEDEQVDVFWHLPVLLLHDGSIWPRATRFMLSQIHKDTAVSKVPSPATLEKKANSLKAFADFFVSEGIDYLSCDRPSKSPLRRYRRYLNDKRNKGDLSASTIKTKMSHVVEFYRYLIDKEGVRFKVRPWEDRETKIAVPGRHGTTILIDKTSADVAQVPGVIRNKPEEAPYRGRIADGGDLRPMNEEEQIILSNALLELDNIEMTLTHLNGLMSGARRQTILTWRRHQFEKDLPPNIDGEVMLKAGVWAGRQVADCKDSRNNSKAESIWMPSVLYKKMQVYLASDRAQNRLDIAQVKYPRSDPGDQYAFLSAQGNPLYMAKMDIYRPQFRRPPNGQSLEQFISDRLKPMLVKMGFPDPANNYKFHDTRATFGTNLVRQGIQVNCALLRAAHPDWNEEQVSAKALETVFGLVKTRLNHSSLATTEQYLSFDFKSEVISKAQRHYEAHVASLFEPLLNAV